MKKNKKCIKNGEMPFVGQSDRNIFHILKFADNKKLIIDSLKETNFSIKGDLPIDNFDISKKSINIFNSDKDTKNVSFCGDSLHVNNLYTNTFNRYCETTINIYNLKDQEWFDNNVKNVSVNTVLDQQKSIKQGDLENDFYQVVINNSKTFDEFVNLIGQNVLEQWFEQLFFLKKNGLSEINLSDFVTEFEFYQMDNVEMSLFCSTNNSKGYVVFSKVYNMAVKILFKNQNWNYHDGISPGFHVLNKYYQLAKKNYGLPQKIDDSPYHFEECGISFERQSSQKNKILEISKFLGIEPLTFVDTVCDLNPCVIYNVSLSKFELKKNYGWDKLSYGQLSEILPLDIPLVDQPLVNNTRLPMIVTHSKYTSRILGLVRDNEDLNCDTNFIKQVQKYKLPNVFLELYFNIYYPDSNYRIYQDTSDNISKIPFNIDYNIEQEWLIDEVKEVHVNDKLYYGVDKLEKTSSLFYLLGSDFSEYSLLSKEKKILKYQDAGLKILKNSSKYGNILSKDKKRIVNSCFPFINKTASNVSDYNIWEILDYADKQTPSDRKNIYNFLILRFGDPNLFVTNLFFCINNVNVSENMSKLLGNLQLVRIKFEYWLSFFKKFSLCVKNWNNINGYDLTYEDFLNMQYFEMCVAQIGSDGKKASDIAKERMYQQLIKQVLRTNNYVVNQSLADNLFKNIMRLFWKKVFNLHRENKTKDRSPIDIIKGRSEFGTGGSAGGCQSGFNDQNIVKQMFPDISKGSDTKEGVFNSERHEFFIMSIFDIPLTLCTMILKPKEFAKQRYIYSVWMPHYIINSSVTYQFEQCFDQLGIQMTDFSDGGLIEQLDKKHGNIFNCIDFSEYNDQHEERHKKMIWEAFSDEINLTNHLFKKDLTFFALWLKNSCSAMILKTHADPSSFFVHKGRLFSGERSTTLTNSIMAVCYHGLISINVNLYTKNNDWKLLTDLEIKEACLHNGNLSLRFEQLLTKNRSMGDDNLNIIGSIWYANTYNQMALMSGLVLKIEKCLIGVNCYEFLREMNSFDKRKLTKKVGYITRSIVSTVSGNLEGSEDRFFKTQIEELHSKMKVIIHRGGNKQFLHTMFEIKANNLLKLTRKVREKNKKTLDIRWCYIEKKFGGLGLFTLNTKQIFKIKGQILNLDREDAYGKLLTTDPVYPMEAKRYLITQIQYREWIKFGQLVSAKYNREIKKYELELIESNSGSKQLYSSEFIEKYLMFCDKTNAVIKTGKFVNETKQWVSRDQKELEEKVFKAFGTMRFFDRSSATTIKKIDSLIQISKLYKFNKGITIEHVIKKKLGKYALTIYKIIYKFDIKNRIPEIFQDGDYMYLFGIIYNKIKYNGNLDSLALAFNKVILKNINL